MHLRPEFFRTKCFFPTRISLAQTVSHKQQMKAYFNPITYFRPILAIGNGRIILIHWFCVILDQFESDDDIADLFGRHIL
jgi:hypothetical protein